ncbi:F0F1 ATP synthase subunit B [Candidatus Nomurabacteria bacterium]|nr:F0F1 ATP synthase subunit B [Candidatus Nomurabacteria bacterium]
MDLGEILGRVGFDWQVATANLVNFLVIFIILKVFVWTPVQNIINKRKEIIDQGLKDAEEAKQKLSAAEEEAGDITKQAKEHADHILRESRDEGNAIKTRIEEGAYKKEAEIIEQGHQEVREERKKMMQDVQGEAANLVVDAVAQILEEEVNQKKHDEYSSKVASLIKNRS